MDLVLLRGGGDIATGVAHRLFRAGFKVIIIDIKEPTNIRRQVSFAEAIYSGEIEVEGVKAVFAENLNRANRIIEDGAIAVLVDEKAQILDKLKVDILVDAILAKKNLGTNRSMAAITIGLGPGFIAGQDVDLVIETNRGHYLGRVIENGGAMEDTGIPGSILGFTEQRIIRALDEGIVENYKEIGHIVKIGDIICKTGNNKVPAKIDGVIRGLIKEGLYVKNGMKIGDIDPRGVVAYTNTISDKARAIGGAVLEAIMYKKRGDI